MANSSAADWDEGAPLISDPRRQGAGEILNLRKATRARLAKEHDTPAAASVGGEHKQGSAKCYYQSAEPTLRPDGVTALSSADYGRLWIDSDDGSLYRYTATGWVAFDTSVQSFDLPGAPGADEAWTYGGSAFPLSAPFSLPVQVSGLNAGRWMFWVAGTFDGSTTGSLSITINGQTRTYTSSSTVDGQVPFLMCVRATVTSANRYARITAASGLNLLRLDSFSGVFIG